MLMFRLARRLMALLEGSLEINDVLNGETNMCLFNVVATSLREDSADRKGLT